MELYLTRRYGFFLKKISKKNIIFPKKNFYIFKFFFDITDLSIDNFVFLNKVLRSQYLAQSISIDMTQTIKANNNFQSQQAAALKDRMVKSAQEIDKVLDAVSHIRADPQKISSREEARKARAEKAAEKATLRAEERAARKEERAERKARGGLSVASKVSTNEEFAVTSDDLERPTDPKIAAFWDDFNTPSTATSITPETAASPNLISDADLIELKKMEEAADQISDDELVAEFSEMEKMVEPEAMDVADADRAYASPPNHTPTLAL